MLMAGGLVLVLFGCVSAGIAQEGGSGVALAVLCGGVAALLAGVGVSISLRRTTATVPSIPTLSMTQTPPTSNPPPTFAMSAAPTPMRGISIERRREILQNEINRYIRQRYRVVSQTDTTAQLIRPKSFSRLWFLIWALLLIGWIFYLAWYWMKRDDQVYLEVDENGLIHRR